MAHIQLCPQGCRRTLAELLVSRDVQGNLPGCTIIELPSGATRGPPHLSAQEAQRHDIFSQLAELSQAFELPRSLGPHLLAYATLLAKVHLYRRSGKIYDIRSCVQCAIQACTKNQSIEVTNEIEK
jgi:hypothetical protein